MSRYASVYPLVTARHLARAFTYEVPDDVGRGAVVEVRFGNAKRRGVVVEAPAKVPAGIEPVPIERVVEELPPALIVGFGLHNATEGFGIVAPLAAEEQQPSWTFLGVMGLIAGGPTFVGTLIGQAWTSEALSILFLSLAAGSILYVVVELLHVCRTLCSKTIMTWGILLGLVLGFATDFILVASGA